MPNYIRVKQINPNELSGFFVDSISSESGLLLDLAEQAALNVLSTGAILLTGNQNASGNKTFLNNLNVSGDLTVAGTLRYNEIIDTTVTGNISGYTGIFNTIFANNIVYNTGSQNISGNKTFLNNFVVSGTGSSFPILQITGVNDILINGNNSFGIYQQGLYQIGRLTNRLNGLSFYSAITSGINYTYPSGLKPGNLLIYTTESSAEANQTSSNTRTRTKARPYMVVSNPNNISDSYSYSGDGTIGSVGNFSFLGLNDNSSYSGLAIKQLIFNPTIQNAYRNYNLWSGVPIIVKPKNIHLETFIDVNIKSGNYWSKFDLGLTRYDHDIFIQTPKAVTFTQSHVLNFKLNFERDDRVTAIANYPNRVVRIIRDAQTISVTGYNYEFSQKLRLILNTDGSLKEW